MAKGSEQLRIEVTRGGKTFVMSTEERAILVGSGSHCDLRLMPEDCGSEQLRMTMQEGQVWVETLHGERASQLDGEPFSQGLLADGQSLVVGQARLRIVLQGADAAVGKGEQARDGLPVPVQVAALAALALGFHLLLKDSPRHDLLSEAPIVPALFDAAEGDCPTEDAAYEAQRSMREAVLKGERAPFYARDGVEAVGLFRRAEACFREAGQEFLALEAARRSDRLEADLQGEFKVRGTRLARLLRRKKYADARQEVAVLQDFIQQRPGAYGQWLGAVERDLNTRFARTEKR